MVRRRILTLGDGNFSYSLALAKKYQTHATSQPLFHLTATSYDSFDEVVAKYPESQRICLQLKDMGVTVLHRIDATNLRESLVAAGVDANAMFDVIVFNHPHCGEENVRRHQSLLSHFYSSAVQVLAKHEDEDEDEWSGIVLTLAEGQPERWQAVERAVKAGLKLSRQVENVDEDEQFGVVYDRKRHQNGKSFYHVTLHGEKKRQISPLFIFRRQEEQNEEKATCDRTQLDVSESGEEKKKTSTSRKRKAETHVLGSEFSCTKCEKSFKSAQGLRTHVHMVHELEAGAPLNKKVVLPCDFCDRTFHKEDAKRQHELAKHGKDPLIKPDWFEMEQTTRTEKPALAGEKEVNSVARTTLEPTRCSICELSFTSVQDFDAHWQKLQPRATAKRKCSSCDREFDEARALRQHQNFCNQKSFVQTHMRA